MPPTTLLIVEDDVGLAELVSEALETLFAEIAHVTTGKEALRWLEDRPASLLLLDYKLPDMTCVDLLRQLQASNTDVPPFLVTTGAGDERVAVELMKLGARDYLIKDAQFLTLLPRVVSGVLRSLETERALVEAELALRASEHRLRELLDRVRILAMQHDTQCRLTYCNDYLLEILGYSREDLLGQVKLCPLWPGAGPGATAELLPAEQVPAFVENEVVTASGETRWIAWNNTVLKDRDGTPVGTASLGTDITEQKRFKALLERRIEERTRVLSEREADLQHANLELAQAARLKDEFLASTSHELRTPLTGILGICEALREGVYGTLSSAQQEQIMSVDASGRHLLSLINDILDLSKLQAGALEIHPENVSAWSVCQESLQLVDSLVRAKNQRVSVSFESMDIHVRADTRGLKQVLVNLLANAVKFTPATGQLGVEVGADEEGGLVHFSVWDRGVGIAAADLGRLFQPFTQLDSSLNRRYAGTGLGLALVQRLTTLMGGSVAVESTPNEGSRFTVTLPSGKPHPRWSDHGVDAASTTTDRHNGNPGRVLVADDNAINARTYGDYLRSRGYEVVIARDGSEALEQARRHRPDLILMDVQMPTMDGLEATRRLRIETDASLASTPVFALTALAMPGDRERCLAAGVDAYIAKPVSLKSLEGKIASTLACRMQAGGVPE